MGARRYSLPRLLAGLQIGILGGLATIVWIVILSMFYFGSPWVLLNLFATSTQRSLNWTYNLGLPTWNGGALHMLGCGAMGMLMGFVLPKPSPSARVSYIGVAFGVIVSLLVWEFFWRRQVPLLTNYTGPGAILLVHAIFGACTGLFPRFMRMEEAEEESAVEEN